MYHFPRHIAAGLARDTFVALTLPLCDMLVFPYPFMHERSFAITMAGYVPALVLNTPVTPGLPAPSFRGGGHP